MSEATDKDHPDDDAASNDAGTADADAGKDGDESADAGKDGDEGAGASASKDAEDKAERAGDDADDGDVVASPAKAAPVARPSYVFLAVVTIVTLALDLGTKIWAEKRFENARGAARMLEVVKDLLIFRLARNKGGAWGILSGESPALRISFFIAISIVAVAFIITLYRKTTRDQKALTWGLPLVLGGALGNLVDRIRYGEVIDFIEVHLGSYQHPTFNIADIAIVVGVGLMAIDMFTPRRRPVATVPDKGSDTKSAKEAKATSS